MITPYDTHCPKCGKISDVRDIQLYSVCYNCVKEKKFRLDNFGFKDTNSLVVGLLDFTSAIVKNPTR